MTTKLCRKCSLVKSLTEFNKNPKNKKDGRQTYCKNCQSNMNAANVRKGLEILQTLARTKGSCNICQRLYKDEDWHFFEFDHIDPTLKLSKYETMTPWIAHNVEQFFERVVPNLQLLCVKCHKEKTSEELRIGGRVHQRRQENDKPAQVIYREPTLFDPIVLLEAHETGSITRREGPWITVRDLNGNLIRYDEYAKYLKKI